MNANEQEDLATQRAAYDVMTKSANEASPDGSVEDNTNAAPPEDCETGTRAGGDVIIKGASQKQEESQ